MKYIEPKKEIIKEIPFSIINPEIMNVIGATREVTKFFIIYIFLNLTLGYEYNNNTQRDPGRLPRRRKPYARILLERIPPRLHRALCSALLSQRAGLCALAGFCDGKGR